MPAPVSDVATLETRRSGVCAAPTLGLKSAKATATSGDPISSTLIASRRASVGVHLAWRRRGVGWWSAGRFIGASQ